MEKIAKENNLDIKDVENIENAMWHWVKTEMTKGERNNVDSFENIYLRYFGTFHVRKGMIKHLKKHDK